MKYPVLDWLPAWVFTPPGLIAVVLLVAYSLSEWRNIRRWWKYRWVDVDKSAAYLRTRMAFEGLQEEAIQLDVWSNVTTSGTSFADVSMGHLIRGVNAGVIKMRGTMENGAAVLPVPTPIQPHGYSHIQNEPAHEGQVGSDGVVYRNLEFSKSGIRKWVKELKGQKAMNLKKARQKGKIEDFIKEHKADPEGDLDKLDAVIKRPTRESGKEARPTSSRASDDD